MNWYLPIQRDLSAGEQVEAIAIGANAKNKVRKNICRKLFENSKNELGAVANDSGNYGQIILIFFGFHMGILRSETMRHGTLVLPAERARFFIESVGSAVQLQIEDMNSLSLRRNYRRYIQRYVINCKGATSEF